VRSNHFLCSRHSLPGAQQAHYSRFRRRLSTAPKQNQRLAEPGNVKIAIGAVESAYFG
jgi:hypothetical protein